MTAVAPAEEVVAAWAAAEPAFDGSAAAFAADERAAARFLTEGERLLAALAPKPARGEREHATARALVARLTAAREAFLRAHAARVYDELTGGLSAFVRLEELVQRAAERFPGLVPDRETLAAEAGRALRDKEGAEIAHGVLAAALLSSPACGSHLIHAMQQPKRESVERLEEFRVTGEADLGTAHARRAGRVGYLELRNPRFLNAEDDTTTGALETAADLLLLDPGVEVIVMRGGVLDHPAYSGTRIFGSGINLTRLYRGELAFLFYLVRDLGFVNKIYRGLAGPQLVSGAPETTTEKPWIAAVDTYAIGGACQLLHVMDHVIVQRGTRMYLPARKEGIIPGASDLRLRRSVGDRLARRAILSGYEFLAGTPEGALLCDDVVEPEAMDAAIDGAIEVLAGSGLVSVAANRKAMRVGEEPLDTFRAYMATYAREQATCHFSPALVRNLEANWQSRRRRLTPRL